MGRVFNGEEYPDDWVWFKDADGIERPQGTFLKTLLIRGRRDAENLVDLFESIEWQNDTCLLDYADEIRQNFGMEKRTT